MNVSLAQSAAALNANARWQESIAENLASSSVPGFKKQELSFSAIAAGQMSGIKGSPRSFVLPSATASVNFRPGEMRQTGVDTDIALDGAGFLPVMLPDGNTAYTRDGELRFDPTGVLVTKEGYEVLGRGGPVQLDPTISGKLSISLSGRVTRSGELVGNLQAMEFENPELLTQISRGLFTANHPDLIAQDSDGTQFRQGFIEGSNASPVNEMAQLINAMRIYEANQRALQSHDDRMGKAIAVIGNNT